MFDDLHTTPADLHASGSPLPVGTRIRLLCGHLTGDDTLLTAGMVGVVVVWRGKHMVLFNGGALLEAAGAAYEIEVVE